MLPKRELLLAICDLLISLLSPRTCLPFCIPSVLARKPAEVPSDGLGDLVGKIFPRQVC